MIRAPPLTPRSVKALSWDLTFNGVDRSFSLYSSSKQGFFHATDRSSSQCFFAGCAPADRFPDYAQAPTLSHALHCAAPGTVFYGTGA